MVKVIMPITFIVLFINFIFNIDIFVINVVD